MVDRKTVFIREREQRAQFFVFRALSNEKLSFLFTRKRGFVRGVFLPSTSKWAFHFSSPPPFLPPLYSQPPGKHAFPGRESNNNNRSFKALSSSACPPPPPSRPSPTSCFIPVGGGNFRGEAGVVKIREVWEVCGGGMEDSSSSIPKLFPRDGLTSSLNFKLWGDGQQDT